MSRVFDGLPAGLAALGEDACLDAARREMAQAGIMNLAAAVVRIRLASSEQVPAEFVTYLEAALPPRWDGLNADAVRVKVSKIGVDAGLVAFLQECARQGITSPAEISARIFKLITAQGALRADAAPTTGVQQSPGPMQFDYVAAGNYLRSVVKGQDAAIEQVLDRLRLARQEADATPWRPDAVFLCDGPSGVGKTHLARHLPRALYGRDNGTFAECGTTDWGTLTTNLAGAPDSVLIFDNLERTNVTAMNAFAASFHTGAAPGVDGQSATVSHLIIVMTSNLGKFQEAATGATDPGEGHDLDGADLAALSHSLDSQRAGVWARGLLEEAGLNVMAREITDVITFEPLDAASLRVIALLSLESAIAAFTVRGIGISYDTEVVDEIIQESAHGAGASEIERVVERRVRIPAARVNPGLYRLRVHEGLVVLARA